MSLPRELLEQRCRQILSSCEESLNLIGVTCSRTYFEIKGDPKGIPGPHVVFYAETNEGSRCKYLFPQNDWKVDNDLLYSQLGFMMARDWFPKDFQGMIYA